MCSISRVYHNAICIRYYFNLNAKHFDIYILQFRVSKSTCKCITMISDVLVMLKLVTEMICLSSNTSEDKTMMFIYVRQWNFMDYTYQLDMLLNIWCVVFHIARTTIVNAYFLWNFRKQSIDVMERKLSDGDSVMAERVYHWSSLVLWSVCQTRRWRGGHCAVAGNDR